jgi:hypothetical protein
MSRIGGAWDIGHRTLLALSCTKCGSLLPAGAYIWTPRRPGQRAYLDRRCRGCRWAHLEGGVHVSATARRVPILRTSERAAFQRCIWRWFMGYRMGLVPIDSASAINLWFGIGVHIALARWYSGPGTKRGPHPADSWAEWSKTEIGRIKVQDKRDNGIIEEKLVPAADLGAAMLAGYIEKYGRDRQWSIIEPEHSGQINVMDPHDPDILLLIYAFTYDLVFRDLADGRIKLGEHKTAKSIQIDHLPLDRQAGAYWAIATNELRASGLIGPKESIAGIEYNFLRKALPDERPKDPEGYATKKPQKQHYTNRFGAQFAGWSLTRLEEYAQQQGIVVLGDRSKVQPKPLFHREFVRRTAHQRAAQIENIQNEALHMNAVRAGLLPLTKNPTYNCQWDCPFYDMCLLDESGGDWRDYLGAVFVQQDPYADHRKSTEEGL